MLYEVLETQQNDPNKCRLQQPVHEYQLEDLCINHDGPSILISINIKIIHRIEISQQQPIFPSSFKNFILMFASGQKSFCSFCFIL